MCCGMRPHAPQEQSPLASYLAKRGLCFTQTTLSRERERIRGVRQVRHSRLRLFFGWSSGFLPSGDLGFCAFAEEVVKDAIAFA